MECHNGPHSAIEERDDDDDAAEKRRDRSSEDRCVRCVPCARVARGPCCPCHKRWMHMGSYTPPGGSSSSPFSSRYLAASVISFILASASIYFACIEVEWSGVMTSELPAANAAAVDSKRARQLSML